MWKFLAGVVIGVGAKTIYDLFKDEQIPTPVGLNAGRIESLLDETRQSVRDLREELRQTLSTPGSLQEKAGRALGAAVETVGGRRGEGAQGDAGAQGNAGTEVGRGASQGSAGSSESLMLTSDTPSGGASAGGERQTSQGQSSGGSPPSTHGTIQTMS